MKKAEEYLKQLFEEPFNLEENSIEDDFLQIVKQIQVDTIKETCRVCADNADLTYVEYEWEIPEGTVSVGDSEYGYNYIDKQSILSVADKLKKELE